MKIMYINLDRSLDRRVRMETLLADHGLAGISKRFAGIIAERPLNGLSLSETGCLMSHLSLLGSLSNGETSVILEDDICFSKDFFIKINEISTLLEKSNLDVIFLGQTILFDDVEMHAKTIKVFSESKQNNRTLFLHAKEHYRYGSFGYVINKNSFAKINKLLGNLNLNREAKSIDVLIGRWLKNKILTGAIAVPYLVGVDSKIDSTINDRGNEFEHRLHCELVNLYLGDSSPAAADEWLDILNEKPNLQALAVCRMMYDRLTQ